MTQARNARGQVTTSSYDAAGQLVKRTTPEGDVAQSFDAVGRRTKLIDRSGTTTFGYDAVSRLTSMTSVAGEVSYSYDAAGRRESLTAGGHTASYAYDAAGRLSTVTVGAAVTRYAHDADGQVASITRPNGVVSSYGYDAAGRVTDLSHVKSGTDVASFRYTLDAAGNRTAVDGPSGKESYTLDAGGRLTKVTYGDGETVSYGYDAAGNRTSSTAGGTTTVYGYDAAGRLDSVGGSSVKRDADGNVLSEGGRSYGYDSGNQLVDMSAGGVTTQYGYDGDVRRVSTRTGAQAPVGSVYDSTGDYPVLLARGATTFQRDSTGALLGETTGGTTLTPLVDALGTVRATTSASGAVVGTAAYDVYGAVRAATGPQSVLGFTGAPSDAAGLVDLNAREYSPALGQFLQRDTVRPAGEGTVGWNTFTYGNNNPTTYTDPSGHMSYAEAGVAMDISGALQRTFAAVAAATLLAVATDQLADLEISCVRTGDCITVFQPERDFRTPPPEPETPTAPRPVPVPDIFPRPGDEEPREGQIVYRVYGGNAGLNGRSWTPVDPTNLGPDEFRVAAGLPDRLNAGTMIAVGRLVSTQGIVVREALPVTPRDDWGAGASGAAYRSYPGGLPEYVIPNPASQVKITRIVAPERAYGGPPKGCKPAPVGCEGEGPY